MNFNKQILRFIQEYRRKVNGGEMVPREIASWLLREKKCAPSIEETVVILTRHVSAAMRTQFTTDNDGRRVRQKHAVRRKIKNSDGSFTQQTFWHDIDLASPQFMYESFQQRRGALADGCWQLDQDVTSYNKFHNKGAPLQLMFDFRDDMEERRMFLQPTEDVDANEEIGAFAIEV